MRRREFLGSGLGAMAAAGVVTGQAGSTGTAETADLTSPRRTKLAVRPVMTNIVHTGVWEGPCRFHVIPPAQEKANAQSGFATWSSQVAGRLGQDPGIELLAPVHITFSEDFRLTKAELSKLTRTGSKPTWFWSHPAETRRRPPRSATVSTDPSSWKV